MSKTLETMVTRQHYLQFGRFVFSPTAEVDKRLTTETTDLKTDIKNLEKKLQYLETTHKNSREHIDQIFNSGGRS
jgi:prefoldin subunit 1